MKTKIVFDTTDADTIAASDSIGAFLRSADGTLITSTTVGGKEALDVRVAEGINVEVDLDAADDSVQAWLRDGAGTVITSTAGALDVRFSNTTIAVTATDLDIRDLAFATDKVDASGSVVALDAATLAALESITVSGSVTVSATDLDIRDLTFASDKVDASGSEVSLDAATLAALENITVSATDLDIRDLTSATDSVSALLSDAAGNALTSTAGALDVNIVATVPITTSDAALATVAVLASATSVTTDAALIASVLSNRKYVMMTNTGNRVVYIGAPGVSAATGFPLHPGSLLEMRAGAAVAINAIADAGTQNVRTLQLS